MLGVGGWKTIVGVFFLAFSQVLPQMEALINPLAYQWIMIVVSFVGIVLTGLGIGNKIEKAGAMAAAPKTDKQSGKAKFGSIATMAAVSIIGLAIIWGCAPNQSATQQISAQTNDPVAIANAVYLDALTTWNESLKSYLPYKAELEKSNPQAAAAIRDAFNKSDALLQDFKKYAAIGLIGSMDSEQFRHYMQDIALLIAKQIDERSE